MTGRYLEIVEPFRAEVKREEIRPLAEGESLVRIERTAVSAGSEMHAYTGTLPVGMALDDSIDALSGNSLYPLRYGYAAVGSLEDGERVFLFHPHADFGVVPASSLIAVPPEIGTERAVLYANLETALTLALDGAPRVGEAVLVLGYGTVGRLLTMILSTAGVHPIVVVEPREERRTPASDAGGVTVVGDLETAIRTLENGERLGVDHPRYRGFDLVYEVTGNPAALDDAVAAAGFGATIVVGSWYGVRSEPVSLGGRFHRARLRIVSSQVTTLDGALAMRWTRERRTAQVWRLISALPLDAIPSETVDLSELPDLYGRLAVGGGDATQYFVSCGEK